MIGQKAYVASKRGTAMPRQLTDSTLDASL